MPAVLKTERLACWWCKEQLDDEQSANPAHDTSGEVMCDECHDEEYRDECRRCGNTVDKTELEAQPGELIAILQKATGLSNVLEPGYYRVKEWPFFANGIIEAFFYDDHLERVADLDELAVNAAEYTYCESIPLCGDCRLTVGDSINKLTWRRRKRAHEKGRARSNNPRYWYRYQIGSDCRAGGKKVGWTAVVSNVWWWRTKTRQSDDFDCESDAMANFEYEILGIVPTTQHRIGERD